MDSLTEREQKIFGELSSFIKEKGYPPSQRELAKRVGLKSPNTVDYHLKKLEAKGLVRCPKNRFRAVEIMEPREALLPAGSLRIPILGTVPAGPLNLAQEQQDEFLELDRSLAKGRVFGLKVKGDSMKDAGILEGDIAVVRVQPTAEDGEIVVARMGDEATVKVLRRRKKGVILEPANKNYKPIPIKDISAEETGAEIVGKVVAIVRKF
jgi:repressor LexA